MNQIMKSFLESELEFRQDFLSTILKWQNYIFPSNGLKNKR